MLSSGLCPRQLWLPCCRQGPGFAEMPLIAHLGSGSLGKSPISRFVVMEGRPKGTDQVPGWLQAAPAWSWILLTTVTCLSNYAQEVACCVAAFPLPVLFHASLHVIADSKSLLIFPVGLRNDL